MSAPSLVVSLGAGDLAPVALMLVPTAAIFASVLLAMSIYAKSSSRARALTSRPSYPRRRVPMLSEHRQFSVLSIGTRLRGYDVSAK